MDTNISVSEKHITKAIAGDKEAFTWVYKNYHQRVYFSAIQFFKDEDTAQDIVQEVFILVYKNINSLQSPKAFISWLHVLTYRTCINYKRRKVKLLQFGDEGAEESIIDDKSEDVNEYLENKRIKKIVVNSLDSMSLPLRLVGQMKFLDEMKNIEIAKILDIPKATVASRLVRIRKLLQTDLEKNGISRNVYGSVIISPLFLYEAYTELWNNYMMNETISNDILSNVLKSSGIVIGGVSSLAKWLFGGVSLMVGCSVVAWNLNHVETKPIDEPKPVEKEEVILQDEKNAEISEITYNTQWQQTAVELTIKTTNNNYDKITINDIETVKISNNGNYSVKLIKNEEVIDEKEVIVSNIDRNSPMTISEEDDEYYYFYLSDDLSGININSIKYSKNGIDSNEYTYFENEGRLQVKNDMVSQHEIYISDNAGNVLSIEIK